MRTYRQYCGLARALDLVGDRWTLLIVRELLVLGPSRYTDLRHGLPGIATNLLGDRLREMEEAGLETVPGEMVSSPRILAAPAALECRRHTTLQVGPAREIILGEVVGVFVRSDAVNASNLHIDQQMMDAVGRMGGHSYTRTRDQFDVKTWTPPDWESRRLSGTDAAE